MYLRIHNWTIVIQVPALIYRFTEAYFQNNLQGQENDGYVHANGYYTKTVPQADLSLEFGVNANGDDSKYKIIYII